MISLLLYRLWREANDAGLRITPVFDRDSAAGAYVDFVWDVSGPRLKDMMTLTTSDLEDFIAGWLVGYYRDDPAARERAAERGLRLALDRTST